MSADTAMHALRFAADHRAAEDELVVSLYGGEPLMNPALVYTVLNRYDEILEPPVWFWLCTNGSIFDEPLFEKTVSTGGTIIVSLGLAGKEGNESGIAWEEMLPPTVRMNIDRLLERWPSHTAFIVTSPGAQSLPLWLRESLPEPVRERLTFRPLLPLLGECPQSPVGTRQECDAFVAAYEEWRGQLRLPAPVEGIALDEGFHRTFFRLFFRDAGLWPCGAAASEIAVAPDGSIFPCAFFVGVGATRIGNVRHGLDRLAVESFFFNVSERRAVACASCWARPLCRGGCPRSACGLENRWSLPSPGRCAEFREAIERGIAVYSWASRDGILLQLVGLR